MITPAANGRREPYTAIGICRMKCGRCLRRRARYQWNICADRNRYRPICPQCDYALNALVLRFMRDPDRAAKLAVYRRRLGLGSRAAA